jgi:UDP:flavonoid glycosyltransferase YjiC (YdhE family)
LCRLATPDEVLSSVPENARLDPFIPFGEVMRHVSVMVTNGGYGGTHYALTHGVPLVAAGKSEDKAEVCARIGWSGVGVNLKTAAPEPEQIRSAVKTVLSDPCYREKATAMREELARYDAPTFGADIIESLTRRSRVPKKSCAPCASGASTARKGRRHKKPWGWGPTALMHTRCSNERSRR